MEEKWNLNLDLRRKDQNLQDMEIGRLKENALIFDMSFVNRID